MLDTNILLRGLLNMSSAAGRVVQACDERTVLLLLSKSVLTEYRAVLSNPAIVDRYPELTSEKVDLAIRRLRFSGEFLRKVAVAFEFPRDPKDEMIIELAIAGRATHIVTADKDLHSLTSGRGDAAKRFRQHARSTVIVDAAGFLDDLNSVRSRK